MLISSLLMAACGGGGDGGGAPAAPPPASDLSGEWAVIAVSTGGNYEGLAAGAISFNTAGSVTGGYYYHSNGIQADFTGGSLAVYGEGL
jgi:hypothetical protein